MIWSLVVAQREPQVIALKLEIPEDYEDGTAPYHIRPGRLLYNSTENIRTMLSFNRQSRAAALQWLPDTLTINGEMGATVRFNKQRDLVFLEGHFGPRHLGFSRELDRSLSFNSHYPDDPHPPNDPIKPIWHVMKFLRPFQNLKHVYYCIEETGYEDYDLRWCASNKTNRYEQSVLHGWDEHFIAFCWPNLIYDGDKYVCEEESYYSRSDYDQDEFKIGMALVRGEKAKRIDPYLSEEDMRSFNSIGFFRMAWFNDFEGYNRHFELDLDCPTPNDSDEESSGDDDEDDG
ncbi:hypothetical protein F5Y16DRAFT_402853 [Xylariaceae sp. FL0255]|nr:hypothetical protein F5Y16DRAFT_402853 [Xylariaceae sp. FL0255]